MSNPKVAVVFGSSNLGIQAASAAGTFGLIAAIPAANTSGFGIPVLLKSVKQAKTELASPNNAGILKAITDGFYGEVAEGSPLYCLFLVNTTSLEDMISPDNTYVSTLKTFAQNKLRGIGVVKFPADNYSPTLFGGFDLDVHKCVIKAQAQATITIQQYKPIEFVIQGYNFTNATDAKDYTTTINKNVHIVIGSENSNSAVSVLRALGKKASKAVQKNIGRVKSGSLNIAQDAVLQFGQIRTTSVVETKATATLTITGVGSSGAYFDIYVTDNLNSRWNLTRSTYNWSSTEDTVTKIAAAVVSHINGSTSIHGYSATNAAGVVTITAKSGYGSLLNGVVLEIFTSGIAFSKTAFAGGVNPNTTLDSATLLSDTDPVDLDTLHDKGYITYITNEDAPGFIFNDDVSLTDPTSDYATWSHNAVLAEAMRIAYATFYKTLKDDVDVDENGQLGAAVETNLSQDIIDTINKELGGNISGVNVLINPDTTTSAGLYAAADIDNPNLNLTQSGKLYVFLTIRPKGYIKDVLVVLGFGL